MEILFFVVHFEKNIHEKSIHATHRHKVKDREKKRLVLWSRVEGIPNAGTVNE